MKYIQKLDLTTLKKSIVLPKGLIINRANLNYDEEGQDLLMNEDIRIINAIISFNDRESIPDELELSESNRKSLKKVTLKVDNINEDSDSYEKDKSRLIINRVVKLVKTLYKDFKVIVIGDKYEKITSFLEALPKGVSL